MEKLTTDIQISNTSDYSKRSAGIEGLRKEDNKKEPKSNGDEKSPSEEDKTESFVHVDTNEEIRGSPEIKAITFERDAAIFDTNPILEVPDVNTEETLKSQNKFQCDSCSNNFISNDDLNRHIETEHISQDYFKCKVCLSQFNATKNLNATT